MSDNETKNVSSAEISQMDQGHIVDNGERKERTDIELSDVWKKLRFIQKKVMEIEKTQKRLEKAVRPEGGSQPSKDLKLIENTDNGSVSFTEVGEDIIDHTLKNGELTTNQLKQILLNNEIERSSQSCRDWLARIAKRFNENMNSPKLEHKPGKQGGRGGGQQSRIVVKK